MITYHGLTEFTLQSEDPSASYNDLPTIQRIYKGAAISYDSFWGSVPLGRSIDGGYIVKRDGKNQGMYPEISITLAMPPDFEAYTVANAWNIQSTSIGRTVNTTSIIPGCTSVEAQHKVTFVSPQVTYAYWASSMPSAPRFSSAKFGSPILISSNVTANAGEGTPSAAKTKVFYGTIPLPLYGPLSLNASTKLVSHSSTPVVRTPWYQCQDILASGYWGDES